MSVDVTAETIINRSRDDVAGFAMDPENDPVWIGGIVEARMLTEPPLAQGTRVERLATFLGRRIEYVLEVVEYHPSSLLAMRSVKGPFPMQVSYEFEETDGGTLARIHIQGGDTGFYKLAGPLLTRTVKRHVANDLKTLKDLLESGDDKP